MISHMIILSLLSQATIEMHIHPLVEPAASCTTADNENGTCIPVQFCKVINQVANRSLLFPHELKYLQRSICDQKQPFNVCCPVSKSGTSQEKDTTSAKTTLNDSLPQQLSALIIRKPTATISAKKCQEYQNFGSNLSSKVKTPICPLRSQSLIIGGDEAAIGEFPHMALIGYKRTNTGNTDWSCGGSLISELFVLSAAHCEDLDDDPATHARLGEHDISRTDEVTNTVDFDIVKRIVHPQYRRFYNDIMLLQLNRIVKFSAAIRPICLPEQYEIQAENGIASGWGLTMTHSRRSNILLKVNLDFFSQKECSEKYSETTSLKMGIVEQVHLCAGSRVDDKDTCKGDSGGPIQIHKGDSECVYTILGVISFGSCGLIGFPGVYTRVYSYLDWIEKNVWPNE